jgi:predicted Na+-dependent transporter
LADSVYFAIGLSREVQMDIWVIFSVISLSIASIAIFIGGFMAFFMYDTAEQRRSWKKFKPVIISLIATFLIFLSLGYVFMVISSQLPA